MSRLTLVALLLTAFGLTFAVYDRYEVEREMASRRENAEEELKREGERQADLQNRVDYLNNDQGMEAEIRRHFDVALEGEQVVVIVDEEESGITALSATQDQEESRGFWERWWPW